MLHDIVFAYRDVRLIQTGERFEIQENGQLLAVAKVAAVAERLFLYRALAIATAVAEEEQQQARFTPAGKLVYFPPPPAPEEKTKQKKTAGPFKKPTVEEINDYCRERGNGLDGQAIHDHYESNGWMVGRVKMKDWKAAVRTWERKEREGTLPSRRSRVQQTNPEHSSFDVKKAEEDLWTYRPKFQPERDNSCDTDPKEACV